jgi:hypothetical protein
MKGILETCDKDMWCYVAKKSFNCYKCLKSIINKHLFNGLIVVPNVRSSLKHLNFF